MTAPTLTTLYQIGIDNAQIQVPQNYTVPANPPSMPNPPNNLAVPTNNTQTTTTSDSVTIYLSAIKGFNNSLYMSFLIQPMTTTLAASLGYNLPTIDQTTAPWVGLIGSTSFNWLTGVYDSGALGWVGPLPFSMQSNNGSALNTYVATNYQTLWINPGLTGGAIDPSHPPSYLVTIFAFDPVTNTYTSCNFTLVVMPSVANYGLGVYTIGYVGPSFVQNIGYTNSVTLPFNGYANNEGAILDYYFYPLEPASDLPNSLPNGAPTPLNITLNWYGGITNPIIDTTNSVINYYPSYTEALTFSDYLNNPTLLYDAIPSGFTRDTSYDSSPYLGSYPLSITLYLLANPNKPAPIYNHALLQVVATDGNGVSVTAYTAIYSTAGPTT